MERGDQLEGLAIVYAGLAFLARHEKLVSLGGKGHALRTRNAGDFVDTRSFEDTDHFDRIVAEPRNEHPTFAGSKMVETPFHAFERNLPCQANGKRLLGAALPRRRCRALP